MVELPPEELVWSVLCLWFGMVWCYDFKCGLVWDSNWHEVDLSVKELMPVLYWQIAV